MAKKKVSTNRHTQEQDITVSVYTGDLHERVMEGVGREVERQFSGAVGKAITAKVEKLIESIARDAIEKAVVVVLKEGWSRTDEYGGVKGVATLKDRIGEYLNHRERYGNNDRWIDKVVKEEASAALKGELGKELDAARVKLRAEVDNVTRVKLNEALRSALGVS